MFGSLMYNQYLSREEWDQELEPSENLALIGYSYEQLLSRTTKSNS